jgi:hydroxymethylbilane synthase
MPDNQVLTLVCRGSRLSVIQGELVRALIREHFPEVPVKIITKATRGDLDQQTPLYQMGEKHLFTQDIEDALASGEADIAVHSLKDLSVEVLDDPLFFHATPKRDLPHDVVVFSPDAAQRIETTGCMTIGTSSLRRQELVPPFLKKYYLPLAKNPQIEVVTEPIRGNVDTRLRKLLAGECDAIVLAAAGLHRLTAHAPEVAELLAPCTTMLLPLIECPPAAGQGALAVQCLAQNDRAVQILQAIHHHQTGVDTQLERAQSRQIGGGCHQRYGVLSRLTRGGQMTRVAGRSADGAPLDAVFSDVEMSASGFDIRSKRLFSATDFMGDFFKYDAHPIPEAALTQIANARVLFVAHHRAVQADDVFQRIKNKPVWASGTRTWRELVRMGVSVVGCADGFGFRYLDPVFKSTLFGIAPADILAITHDGSVEAWHRDGYSAVGTYGLRSDISTSLQAQLYDGELFFWTNFEQYKAAQPYLPAVAMHACPAGRTVDSFRAAGIDPVVFPSIRAFIAWRIEQESI